MSKHFYISMIFVCAQKPFRNQRWRMAELWMRRNSTHSDTPRERCDDNEHRTKLPPHWNWETGSTETLKIEPNKIVFIVIGFSPFIFDFDLEVSVTIARNFQLWFNRIVAVVVSVTMYNCIYCVIYRLFALNFTIIRLNFSSHSGIDRATLLN